MGNTTAEGLTGLRFAALPRAGMPRAVWLALAAGLVAAGVSVAFEGPPQEATAVINPGSLIVDPSAVSAHLRDPARLEAVLREHGLPGRSPQVAARIRVALVGEHLQVSVRLPAAADSVRLAELLGRETEAYLKKVVDQELATLHQAIREIGIIRVQVQAQTQTIQRLMDRSLGPARFRKDGAEQLGDELRRSARYLENLAAAVEQQVRLAPRRLQLETFGLRSATLHRVTYWPQAVQQGAVVAVGLLILALAWRLLRLDSGRRGNGDEPSP